MKSNNELKKKCMNLTYTSCSNLSEEIYESTAKDLKQLLSEYDYASVFGTLAGIWEFDKAALFFTYKQNFGNEIRKIKVVATIYHRAYGGGVQRANAELMKLWVDMGLKVIFFTEEEKSPLDFTYPSSIKRIIIPNTYNTTERLGALQKYCIEEEVDLFINHDWTNLNFIWDCMLMKTLKIAYAQYCHGHFSWCLSQGSHGFFQCEAFKLCDVIIAISETNARFYQMCGCKSFFVHNPIPTDLKKAKPKTFCSKHVLMVGRLSAEKYPLEALEIFKKVHYQVSDAILDVVGDGPMYDDMKEYVASNDLEKIVVFHGEKSQEEIADFYQNCACELFTSKMEGYPMVVLETKAYGVPIVMYDMPYLFLIKDKKGVLSSKIGNLDEMADNIVTLLRDDSFRISKGKEARESFEELLRYDLRAVWDNILDICANDDVPIQPNDYYNPERLAAEDRYIIPVLTEKYYCAYDNIVNSIDYRIGKKILKIPRKVMSILRTIKKE